MGDRYYLVAVDFDRGTACAGEVEDDACLLPTIGQTVAENFGVNHAHVIDAAASALRAVLPDEPEPLTPEQLRHAAEMLRDNMTEPDRSGPADVLAIVDGLFSMAEEA